MTPKNVCGECRHQYWDKELACYGCRLLKDNDTSECKDFDSNRKEN
jgi:hypothetical protein